MGDISTSKTRQIPAAVFKDMISRVTAWNSSHDNPPLIVYITTLHQEWVTWTKYQDMKSRWDAWITSHHGSEPTFVWVVYPGTSTGSSSSAYPTIPTELPKTNIYSSSPPVQFYDNPQIYTGETVPFYNCVLTFTLFAADSVTFESPNYYEDASRINIIGQHKPFGGILTQRKETINGYSYTCLDHTMKLFGEWRMAFYDFIVSDVLKIMMTQLGLPTNGIQQTNTVHSRAVIVDTTRIDICHQLANLEGNMDFFVNQDGIPILKDEVLTTEGYIFFSEAAAIDYGLDYDANDIITGVKVHGADDLYLYKYFDQNLVVKYGVIEEYINDSNITTTEEAKTQAEEKLKESAKVQFTGTMAIPEILDIYKGEWCIFVPPRWSNDSPKAYYTQEVKVTISDTEEKTEIQFLDGKPTQPSDWIYTDPDTGSSSSCSVSSISMEGVNEYQTANPNGRNPKMGNPPANAGCISGEGYPGNQCAGVIPWKKFKFNWLNYCPNCGAVNKLYLDRSGAQMGIACSVCDVDWCPVSGFGTTCVDQYGNEMSGSLPVGCPPGGRIGCKTRLTPCIKGGSSSCTTTVGGDNEVSSIVPLNINTPALIREWVDAHIAYEFYYDSIYPSSYTEADRAAAVLKRGSGNCYDQSCLVATLLRIYGYSATVVYVYVSGGCGSYVGGHYNVRVVINGVTKTIDTSCSGFNEV